ncbi:hypothetical protein HZS_1395, partial [Henneguya salminicola]
MTSDLSSLFFEDIESFEYLTDDNNLKIVQNSKSLELDHNSDKEFFVSFEQIKSFKRKLFEEDYATDLFHNFFRKINSLESEFKSIFTNLNEQDINILPCYCYPSAIYSRINDLKNIASLKEKIVLRNDSVLLSDSEVEIPKAPSRLFQSIDYAQLRTDIENGVKEIETIIGVDHSQKVYIFCFKIKISYELFMQRYDNFKVNYFPLLKDVIDLLEQKTRVLENSSLRDIDIMLKEIFIHLSTADSISNNDFLLKFSPKVDHVYANYKDILSLSSSLPNLV